MCQWLGSVGATPQAQAICRDFGSAVIVAVELVNVEVRNAGMGGDPGPGFSADRGRCAFQSDTSASQASRLWARNRVAAEGAKVRRNRHRRAVKGRGSHKRRRSSRRNKCVG